MTIQDPVHTPPTHYPPKMDVLTKTFLQIILAAKQLVRHSIMSPNQQRRPLPSLLSHSYSTAPGLSILCFRPGFFSPNPDQTFFLSPDPDRSKIRIRSGKSGSMKKTPKNCKHKQNKKCLYHIQILNTAFWWRRLRFRLLLNSTVQYTAALLMITSPRL